MNFSSKTSVMAVFNVLESRNLKIFFIFSIWNLFISFLQIFNIYIKRAAEIFGVTHTREIYEKAIEALPDEHARYGTLFHFEMKMCLIGNVFWWYKI